MAVYKIFPEKDATLYSYYPNQNTGRDEILELSAIPDSFTTSSPRTSRIIIKFPSSEIEDIIQNKVSGSNFDARLKLFLANASDIPLDYTLYCYPLAQNWDMGVGKFGDTPENTEGASWNNANLVSLWDIGNTNPYITSSYFVNNIGGGIWYTGSSILNPTSTQSFNYITSKDINFDVTNTVQLWYDDYIPNYGLIIKKEDILESNTELDIELKYFSMDTHTIYPPQLEIRWDDFVYDIGEGIIVDSDEIVLSLANNKNEYQQESIQRFRINVRDKYPPRIFQTSSIYLNNKFLPSSSYYSITDLHTNETSIEFSDYTKISADTSSNYFDVYMNGLEPERYYKIIIKTLINDETLIFDNNYYFKILR